MEYQMCGLNISCNDFGVVRDCSDSCESGCFCSNGTVLEDGVCVHPDSCPSENLLYYTLNGIMNHVYSKDDEGVGIAH